MKPIKLISLIFAGVIIVLAAALVISLISYSSSQKSQQKLSAPAKVENLPSKPIQPTAVVAEKPEAIKPKPRQLSKTAQKADKAAKPVVPKTAPAPLWQQLGLLSQRYLLNLQRNVNHTHLYL
jgi:hypothetical protein